MNNLVYLIVAVIIFSTSCVQDTKKSKNLKYFINNEWYNDGKTFFKNDSFISPKYFDNNLQKMVGDTAFKFILTDSTIQVKRIKEVGYYNTNREFIFTNDTLIVDTILYDLKYINKVPKLIIYLSDFPLICTSRNKGLKIEETSNFKYISFLIANYTIGDQIDRSAIKTRGIYNYKNYSIEDCEYIANKKITFKIIGFNHIYAIERKNIPDFRLDDIIKVVTAKLNQEPEYSPMQKWTKNSEYEYEFYQWSKNGIRIILSKSKYIGNESYKNLFNNDDWTLYYDDDVQKIILIETYKNSAPRSIIIK